MVHTHKRLLVISLLAAACLALALGSCKSPFFARLFERTSTRQPAPTQAQRTSPLATQTLFPTLTCTATPQPAATVTPTVPPLTPSPASTAAEPTSAPTATGPVPTSTPVTGGGIPTTPDTPFDVTLSEEEINAYVADQPFSEAGVEITEPRITLAEGAVLVHASVYHEASNLRVGLTVRAQPVVHEGALYAQVDEVTLDDSVKGLTRLLARALIKTTLDQYSGEYGVPVPLDTLTFESVEVKPGSVHIVGRTR